MQHAHLRFAWLRGLVLCAGLSFVAPAPAAPKEAALAETLFQQGREALESGDYETACTKFAESQRLDPGAGALMNWATCEEKLGRVASAWQHWREALSLLSPEDPRVKYAEDRASALRGKVPHLTLTLTKGTPPSAVVLLDGARLGKASLQTPLPVDPGTRTLRVEAPGFEPREYRVKMTIAGAKTLTLTTGPALPAVEPSEPAAATNPWPWVALSVGGVGIVGAIATGLVVGDKRAIVDRECDAARLCSPEGLAAADEGNTFVALNTVSWAVAAVGIGAGVSLLIVDATTSDSPSEPPRSQHALRVAPRVDGAALQYTGTF